MDNTTETSYCYPGDNINSSVRRDLKVNMKPRHKILHLIDTDSLSELVTQFNKLGVEENDIVQIFKTENKYQTLYYY